MCATQGNHLKPAVALPTLLGDAGAALRRVRRRYYTNVLQYSMI